MKNKICIAKETRNVHHIVFPDTAFVWHPFLNVGFQTQRTGALLKRLPSRMMNVDRACRRSYRSWWLAGSDPASLSP